MQNEHIAYNHALGLFIINQHKEILLTKRSVPNYSVPFVWEPPLLEHNQEQQPSTQAETYLQKFDLECDLYEAFTSTGTHAHQVQPFKGGCVVIAFLRSTTLPLHFATDNYKWINLEKLLHDMHEKPVHYATWFKKTIDSVALYLKNLIQEKHDSTKHNLEWRAP